MKLTSRLHNHDCGVGEAWGHVSPLWISAWGWMKSYWKRNVDHVPELGVVMGVHEHVQPLQEEIRIRTHVDKVCSLWLLNLDWHVQIFLHLRCAVFPKIRFVFLSNHHFLISKKVQSDLGPLELVANLATRWCHLPFASRKCCHHMMHHPLFPHFGHQIELLAQIWPQGSTTSISCKLGPQVAQLVLVQNLFIS